MKRLLLIFLVLLLPLQFSWAAAASYCQHEDGKTVQHFGHHVHKHAAPSDAGGDQSKLQVDNDCGYCHLACANIIATHPPALALPIVSTHVESLSHPYRSHIPDGLARPDWRRAI